MNDEKIMDWVSMKNLLFVETDQDNDGEWDVQ